MATQRYPVNVHFIGAMHKDGHNLFMTSVLWSDQNEIIVYRTFQEFEKLHKQMKKKFPPASRVQRSDRIIPEFRETSWMKPPIQKKGPNKALHRLKFLEKYCTDLLNRDPAVSQCPELVQFFQPTDQDLKPEFGKNCAMIMPTEDSVDGKVNQTGDNGTNNTVNNVTQPFITESYRCIASYETKDTKNRPFKIAVNETVDVLIKDKAGWWLVENEGKRMAWFPAPYLERCEEDCDEEDEDDQEKPYGNSEQFCAVRSYTAKNGDEVSVEIGSVVQVLQKSDNGWWLIRFNSNAGYVPSMYLQPYNNPRTRLAQMHKNLCASATNLTQLDPRGGTPTGQGSADIPQPPPSKPAPDTLQHQPLQRQISRSMDVLPNPRNSLTTPSISVEAPPQDYDWGERRLSGNSEGSGFSDDLGSSCGSVWLNLSQPDRSSSPSDRRHSCTPSPVAMGRRHSNVAIVEKIPPSTSDPFLFKSHSSPRVPPRPQGAEILKRCTTLTRKAAMASKNQLGPKDGEIMSY